MASQCDSLPAPVAVPEFVGRVSGAGRPELPVGGIGQAVYRPPSGANATQRTPPGCSPRSVCFPVVTSQRITRPGLGGSLSQLFQPTASVLELGANATLRIGPPSVGRVPRTCHLRGADSPPGEG